MPIGIESQHAESTCHAAMRYISIGRPSVLPPDLLACYPSHKRPSLSDIELLAGKDRIHATDDDIVLLIPNPTPPPTGSDKTKLCWASCLLAKRRAGSQVRPLLMCACHSTASCHLGTTRTLRILEQFYWWVGVNVCTRWWHRHCLKCQAPNTRRLTVRWPIISMPLPDGPDVAVSVDYFGPFRSRHEADTYILLSPVPSIVGSTCSPSLPLSSPRGVQPISR